MTTPKHIFREYDIRGLAEKELTNETCRLIGKAFGTFLVRSGKKRMAVGHDLRPSSERIKKALFEGLLSTGIDVLDLGLIPTPLLYFGVVHFKVDAGISITGSHNPPEYNGNKFQLADRPFYGKDIQGLFESIEKNDFVSGKGTATKEDVITPYLNRLKSEFHFTHRWKVVIDSGHAMSGLVAPRLFKELGQEVIELYTNLDSTFPDHHPDPSVPENLEDIRREVIQKKAAIGIAFDGDADRIGVIDELGNIVMGDRLLLIYARQILKKKKGGAIIGDVKCSPLLYEDIAKWGGRPILWKTGHSLIKAKLKEEKAVLGGELSGHMFFADRWYGFDDAIYAACRILEILDEEKRPLSELYGDLPKVFSTPEIRVEVSDDKKKFEIVRSVVKDLKKEYKVIDIDGARVEFSDGWGLIRASNTQPVLVMRFEANSEKRLAEIRSLIEEKIKKASEALL
ncbi:MAG: phosphomannomutase/phosphoglucomutase [Candidatus Omnitrophica bacterium]|nr:phosphomannomutase/phosphoglucomutase [Candidatus Omnitrophota bacterium]